MIICIRCQKECNIIEDTEHNVSEFWGMVATTEARVEYSECCHDELKYVDNDYFEDEEEDE